MATNTCFDCGGPTRNLFYCDSCWRATSHPSPPAPQPLRYPPPPSFVPRLAGMGASPMVMAPNPIVISHATTSHAGMITLRMDYPGATSSLVPAKKVNTCWGCMRELSEYLDAYYGKEPEMAGLCAKCRGKV